MRSSVVGSGVAAGELPRERPCAFPPVTPIVGAVSGAAALNPGGMAAGVSATLSIATGDGPGWDGRGAGLADRAVSFDAGAFAAAPRARPGPGRWSGNSPYTGAARRSWPSAATVTPSSSPHTPSATVNRGALPMNDSSSRDTPPRRGAHLCRVGAVEITAKKSGRFLFVGNRGKPVGVRRSA